ncbi:hypothetical protein ABB37_03767 [Leptomonas pyrrhocoris]|uniref:tRNA intron endonuclease catalytic domain-containing protein n=1 Tax=Leptomonas pyrrhocoris TaxID=157538 RepID=A0A0N0DW67_LEPPY|nr:hypothetical protein ABB37_03767 [Leptomonas pyrrhocoris]KPA81388.1 hypothetical protein ABB37_03767 [Leptomonas pyrrhocoris]|eukprot:XP_015659827.1 hypothetical protein ABB37_03767 [Leptomonas pyrrhocoris]
MLLTIVGTNGPLFVFRKSTETADFLSSHYPQFAKRSLGWQLSVEEVYCLQSRQDSCAEAGPGKAPDFAVSFEAASAVEQYTALRKAYASDCFIYSELTLRHGYKLRHGSSFGASYIGYRDLNEHGECLFFTGPLTALEQVRAVRTAHSVGKEAVMVLVVAEEAGVTLTRLGGGRAAPEVAHRRKIRRKE